MTPQALAIDAYMDWVNMSLDPGARRDAPWLYPKWKEHLAARSYLHMNLAEMFSKDAREAMNCLVRCLMEEAYCAEHGVEHRPIKGVDWPAAYAGETANNTSQVYVRRPVLETKPDVDDTRAAIGKGRA